MSDLDKTIQEFVSNVSSRDMLRYAKTMQDLKNMSVDLLLSILERTTGGSRVAVLTELRNRGEAKVVPIARKLATDNDGGVAYHAISTLTIFKDKESVDMLILLLTKKLGNKNWNEESQVFVRMAAAWALGVIGDPKAIPVLKLALFDRGKTFRGYTVKSSVVSALREFEQLGLYSESHKFIKVLLICDAPAIQTQMRRVEYSALNSYGYDFNFLTTSEIAEGVKLATERSPAVILVTLWQQSEAALNVVQKFKALPALAKIPIVAIHEQQQGKQYLKWGYDYAVQWPRTDAQVIKMLKKVTNNAYKKKANLV